MIVRGRARRRMGLSFVATGTALAATALAVAPGANASSHREAPLILNSSTMDNTDVYAFTSPDAPDTVTLIASWAPFSDPNGGPNFYPWAEGAHYDINIDSDGDALPNIVYRWVFTTDDRRGNTTFLYNNGPVTSLDDQNLLFRQSYDLIKITDGDAETLLDDVAAAPSNVGPASMPDYQALVDQAVVDVPGGGRSFAGQADDAFFLDLRVFDLVYGGDLSEVGQDSLAGYNTNTIALQVPKAELALNNDPESNPVIGVWSDTEVEGMDLGGGGDGGDGDDKGLPGLADIPGLSKLPGLLGLLGRLQPAQVGPVDLGDDDGFVQVSRLGNPLVNELISAAGMKDAFNASQPVDDADNAALLERVTDPELPRLIESIYGIPAPATPRNDLVEIFLTGITDKSGDDIDLGPLNSQLDNADVDAENFRPSEQLRLNMGIPVSEDPSRFGVLGGDLQGFPNGRRLTDDVVDIEIQALEGAVRTGAIVPALSGGDAVNANDKAFLDRFPYVATANNDGVNTVGGGMVPPDGTGGPGGISLPSGPVVTGLAALCLLGAGAWMMRRRPESTTIHGGAVPA